MLLAWLGIGASYLDVNFKYLVHYVARWAGIGASYLVVNFKYLVHYVARWAGDWG